MQWKEQKRKNCTAIRPLRLCSLMLIAPRKYHHISIQALLSYQVTTNSLPVNRNLTAVRTLLNGSKFHSSKLLHLLLMLYFRLGLQCRRAVCWVELRRLWGLYGRSDLRHRELCRRLRAGKLFRNSGRWKVFKEKWLVSMPRVVVLGMEGGEKGGRGYLLAAPSGTVKPGTDVVRETVLRPV